MDKVDIEDLKELRLDETIKEELYALKDTADNAGALRALLRSEGWQELKKAVLEDAQTAIFSVIKYWKEGETRKLDMAIARLEQLIVLYNTVEGSGETAKEAETLLEQRVQEILSEIG